MEVVKRGVLDSELLAEFGCWHCNSVLKASKTEGRYQCPVCEKFIYIDSIKFERGRH